MASLDLPQLCKILECVLCSENDIRKQAEAHFHEWKQKDPDGLLRGLVTIARGHNETLRHQAAVAIRTALRDFLVSKSDAVWNNLTADTKRILKTELLNALESEAAKSVRRSVCDTVSEIASRLTAAGQWPELPGKLMEFVESPKQPCQAAGLKILGDLVPQFSEIIESNTLGVARIVAACAKSDDADVRYENLGFVTALIQSEPRSVWKHVQGVCPDIVTGLQTLLQQGSDEMAVEFLCKLVEIADTASSFFKPHLAAFIQALFTIASSSEVVDDVRQMSVEVLLCVVEDKPRMCLALPNFVSEMVRILMEMMLTIEHDAEWIDKEDASDENDDITRNYDVGESGLDRIAWAMGGENVMTQVFQLVSQYLAKSEWQYKLVAVMAISQTAEYIPDDEIDAHLKEIVNILLAQLGDPHHRVRYAACQAIGQISLDHQPLFQKDYAEVILPVLINVLDDPSPRVQGYAAAALINFAEEVEKADLMPYADRLLDKLFDKIKPEKPRTIRERCVTTIAVIAGVIEKDFMKYYKFVVPTMLELIVTCKAKDERTLRAKAVECISIIGLSVGLEMFQADAHEVMQALLHVVGAGLDPDHPVKEYIQEAFCRMCRTMKTEFLPYLPHLMPGVLKVLSIQPQVFTDDDDADDMTMASIADGRYTGLKTCVIEEMTQAVDLLSTFIEILGAQFGEYLIPAAQSLLPLLSFPLSDDMKRSALTAMAEVFTAAREINKSEPAAHQTLTLWVGEVLEKVFKDLSPVENDAGIADIELMLAETGGLGKCLRNAGPGVLNLQQVAAVCEKVFALMKESNQRRAAIAARKVDPDNDEEDVSRIEEEESSEQSLRSTLLEIIAAVMSFHSDLFLQTGAGLCKKFIETHLDRNCTADDRALALFVADDVLEFLKDKGALLWPTFASPLVESINDPDGVVRQAAAYGIIQAAKCVQFPTELIQKAATYLVAQLSSVKAREKGSLSSTDDNIIAALGSVVLHRGSCLHPSPEQYLNLWINSLPLKFDDEEGRRVHGDFVDLLVKRSPEVLGPQNANLPRLAAICAAIYRTDFSTSQIDKGIIEFMQVTGFDVIKSIGGSFEKKLQKGLERIHRDATVPNA